MSDSNKLIFGADGRPIVQQIGLAVLKVPRGSPPPTQQLVNAISQVCKCNVVVLPPEYELATGKFSMETVARIHTLCHQLEEWEKQHKKPFEGSSESSPN